MQQRHVTNCHVTRKGSWEMTALSPWGHANEVVSSLFINTLCRRNVWPHWRRHHSQLSTTDLEQRCDVQLYIGYLWRRQRFSKKQKE